jgi:hypothetical protein
LLRSPSKQAWDKSETIILKERIRGRQRRGTRESGSGGVVTGTLDEAQVS